jgi:hypothetical protein
VYQRGQALERVLAVAQLGAEALCGDDEFALAIDLTGHHAFEAGAHARRQPRGVEADTQLHRGRDLVDVLAARSTRTNEAHRDRVRRNARDAAAGDGRIFMHR